MLLVFWRNSGLHNLLFWDFLTFSWNGKKYLKFVILWRVYQSACVQACLSRDTLEHTLHKSPHRKIRVKGKLRICNNFCINKSPIMFCMVAQCILFEDLNLKTFQWKVLSFILLHRRGLSNWSPKSNWFERV